MAHSDPDQVNNDENSPGQGKSQTAESSTQGIRQQEHKQLQGLTSLAFLVLERLFGQTKPLDMCRAYRDHPVEIEQTVSTSFIESFSISTLRWEVRRVRPYSTDAALTLALQLNSYL